MIYLSKVESIGPFEWVLNTASHHRVHHGANRLDDGDGSDGCGDDDGADVDGGGDFGDIKHIFCIQ